MSAARHGIGAQYLLRFDDLSPTMKMAAWRRFLPLLKHYEVKPILAVVPDNRDPELMNDPPDESFWDEMRVLEGNGATIGLHGYQHLCNSPNRLKPRNLMPLHRETEFAGAPRDFQRKWIREGLAILRGRGLRPRVWVAPRHGFDCVTLDVLREEGLEMVSDGLARRPFRWHGVTWLPQQLWSPVEESSGLWTICIHPATATDGFVFDLERFLDRHASHFTSVDRVLASWPIEERSLGDRLFHTRRMLRMRVARVRRMLQQG